MKKEHTYLYGEEFIIWAEFLAASFLLSEKRNKILTNPQVTHKAYPSLPPYKPRGSLELPP